MPVQARTYLDYNASAPLLDCARERMVSVLGNPSNASSVHFEGRAARKTIEAARSSLANLIQCDTANIVFTSGATEAANHLLSPLFKVGGRELVASKLYVGATEHPCVLEGGRFAPSDVIELPVNASGIIELETLSALLESHDGSLGLPLVAIQLANNETGVIQPINEIAEVVHNYDGFLVVDAVQALGKMSLVLDDVQADFLFVSSHKIGGPQGAGAIIMRNAALSPVPLLRGGGQENYHRGGTENVAAIAGFGAACEWHIEASRENLTKKIHLYELRDSIEDQILSISHLKGNKIGMPVFFGKDQNRLGNTSCFALSGVSAETALMALDLDGIALSSGSACSSGKVKGSHVLQAMGAETQELQGALRLSLGWEANSGDAELFLKAWDKLVTRLAA